MKQGVSVQLDKTTREFYMDWSQKTLLPISELMEIVLIGHMHKVNNMQVERKAHMLRISSKG